jgi:molybdenum cofactor synthesis domain-containing protein
MRAGALTVSSSKAAGHGRDDSGPRLVELARRAGASEVEQLVLGDDREAIEAALRRWSDAGFALVLSSGGTGLTHDDVTPEATRAVLDREIPGIAEAVRLASRPHTPHWMLSRGLAGTRGSTLIVNLPGSPSAIEQLAGELAPSLQHALALISGEARHDGGSRQAGFLGGSTG